VDELVGDHAIKFLESQPDDQPFCLSMSFNIAHAEDGDKRPGIGHFPWPKAVDGMYEDGEMPLPRLRSPEIFDNMPEFLRKSMNRSRYFWRWDTPEKYDANIRARFRMLTGMDGTIGRVLKALEKKGVADNTVVIYTADNGYYRAERGFAGKWSHFEESLRVPLVIYDPRQSKEHAGRVVENMALNIDLTATMVDLAGVNIPTKYQGRSLKPILDGIVPSEWRKDYFCEHLMRHGAIPMWEGVRGERYKYARYISQNPVYEFLHDLEKDPDELQNFATDPEYQKVLEEMRSKTADYLEKYNNPERPVDPKKVQSKPRSSSGSIKSIKPNDDGVYQFDGQSYALLGQTPTLDVEDNFIWEMEVKVLKGNPQGAVLLGNRITPNLSDLNFMKVTSQRGVQFYGGNLNKSLKLPLNLPTEKWTKVEIRKTGKIITILVNGKPHSKGQLTFPLPAMPCYLGGDPKQTSETSKCEIRNASVKPGE
jgi:choline-sulfatase